MNKIQTLAEYQQLASRTCPDLGTNQRNELHMWLGIVTEIGETLDIFKKFIAYNKSMDLINLGEELADQCWYAANNSLRVAEPLIEPDFLTEVTLLLTPNEIGSIAATKEEVACYLYTDFLDSSQEHNCQRVFDIAFTICDLYEIDFWQALTNNIAKLQVRYPEKFTNEAALNRDLDAERVELEKTSDENVEGRV